MREDSGVGDPEWARREGMVAFAGFPLKIEDRTMGVVAAFARHPLTEAVLQAFASVADSLAQFIERKRAEEALRLTQFSVEHTSDSVFWTDAQGHIVFVNEAACRSSGRSREELLSLSIPDVDPNYSKEGWGEFWEGFKPRGSITIESRYRTKQARVFPVEVNANYLEFDGNEYSFACVRDITERKEAEDALILERDKLEVVTQNIGAGLTIISRDYQIVWANKVTRDVYGDVVGRKCFEACNGLPVVCPHCGVREIFESGKNRVVCEQWGKNVQGNPVCVEIVATPIRDKDGNVVAALELVAPITERKHAEEARAFLASLVESTSDAIIGTTPEGIIASWNHGAEGLYGYSAEEMIGKYVSDLFPSERSDELAQYLDKISRGERISGFESVRVRNDSSRVDVALTISPVYDTAGKLLEL
jgi:PAS domain S-box-containing protein